MTFNSGIIVIWSGAIVDIPDGFVICDGNNGTPDLRNLFVIGAGDTYIVGDNGGNATHTHDFTGDGHTHTIAEGTIIEAGTDYNAETDEEHVTGTTDNASSLPPYYSLAFIMKT